MLTKIPFFVRSFFPKRLWKIPTEEKTLYLTFDDGPIPEVTPWVLEQLRKYNAKATFFCIGDNMGKHPQIFQQLIFEGHSIGNHTFHHLNGWKTPAKEYIKNVLLAEETLSGLSAKEPGKIEGIKKKFFRPPYGKITLKQAKLLEETGYTIVMWHVISRDYEQQLPPEKCLEIVLKHAVPGSIIVFHDSIKAAKNLKVVLPKVLEHYSRKGFIFKKL